MDDRHLARLADEVERAFPDDQAAQREAWEFLETFMEAWDEAEAADIETAVADSADPRPAVVRRLIAACRDLLQDTAGRVVGALDEVVPPDFAVVLSEGQQSPTVGIDADAAAELGVDPEITVEVGPESVTLIAATGDASSPERLAVVVQSAQNPDDVVVQRFARLDSTIATAHVDISPPGGSLGVAFVIFDPDSE
jgi:hypothetical protein